MTTEAWVIGLDADDTLWDNQEMFEASEALFRELLAPWATGSEVDTALLEESRSTIPIYGYGVKSFVLSMIATALHVSNNQIDHESIARLIDSGKQILHAPVVLLPEVKDVVAQLSGSYDLMLLTKGDLHHQNRKIEVSELLPYLRGAEVMDEKNPATYQAILDRHGIAAAQFIMVGNSMRSDVEPVLAIGGHAVHIPYHLTWAMETATSPTTPGSANHIELVRFGELPDALATLTAAPPDC